MAGAEMNKTQLAFSPEIDFLVYLRQLAMHISGKEQIRCFECAREEELISDCCGPVETSWRGGVWDES